MLYNDQHKNIFNYMTMLLLLIDIKIYIDINYG